MYPEQCVSVLHPQYDVLREFVEVYLVAGFKGQPLKVAQKQRKGRRRRLKGKPGRGTLEQEKPPIFGMMKRGGEVVIKMLNNVQQVTIKPLIHSCCSSGYVNLYR